MEKNPQTDSEILGLRGLLLNFIETKKGPSIIDHLMNYEDDRIQKNLNQYVLWFQITFLTRHRQDAGTNLN